MNGDDLNALTCEELFAERTVCEKRRADLLAKISNGNENGLFLVEQGRRVTIEELVRVAERRKKVKELLSKF